jgi:DNA-binding CsgD family transcriptional regulator
MLGITKQALEALTPKQRRRLRLWLKGKTLTEIGWAEGVTRQAVKKSIVSAKKRLKNRWGGVPKGVCSALK